MKILLLMAMVGWLGLQGRAEGCRVVEGGRILGRDLAATAPEFAGLAPEAEIAPAPVAGVERVFHTQELTRIAREHALPPLSRTLEVCFARRTLTLKAEELSSAIAQAFPTDPAAAPPRVEILDFSRYPIPEGSLEFPRGALTASGLWRGRVVTPEGRSTAVWARVKITDAATGLALPLGPSAEPREVNRGDVVRVEVSSGRAVIAFDAVAESSGRIGEMVLVTSPEKRRVLARVEEKGKVVVKK